jgi:hypothetical protein
MAISFSLFPDCSICKRQADDGGWLDSKNYRFWVCIECDDWLYEMEREKLTDTQYEAVLWAMFGAENEVDHLDVMIVATKDKQTLQFLEMQKEKRKEHWQALRDLLLNHKRNFQVYED